MSLAPGDGVPIARSLIPSEREIESGFHSAPGAPPPLPAAEREPTARARVAATLRSLDPRAIAIPGSAFPIVVFALLSTVGQWDAIAFPVLTPFIKVDMRLDFTFLSTLFALVGIATVAAAPVAGYFADRVNRVRMSRVGAILGHGAVIASGLAPGAGAMVVSRLVSGIGPGIELPARYPLLTDFVPPERRTRLFTFLQTATVVGNSIGVALIFLFFLFLGASWRAILIGTGVLSTTISLLLFKVREPERGALDRIAQGGPADAPPEPPVSWSEAWRISRSIATLRRLWYATPFITVGQLGLATFFFFVIQSRAAHGELSGPGSSLLHSRYSIFILIAIPSIISFVGLVGFFGPAIDRMIRQRPGRVMGLMGVALAVQALQVLLLVTVPWFVAALAFTWIASAITGLIVPAQQALLAAVLPARVRGQGFQSIAPWQLLGYLILPTVGAIGDRYGPAVGGATLIPIFLAGAIITATGGAGVARDMRAAMQAGRAEDEARAARARGRKKVVVCRGLDVHYDGAQVLFGLDFDVEEGEMVALLGTNGAGKTTLLRAIAGVQEPSGGAIFLDGEDITHKPTHLNARDGIVFLPGGRAIFPTLSVAENLRLASWLERRDEASLAGRTEEILRMFPILRERLAQQAGNLSGGEQQMLALGQAFLMRPRLLMIDELSMGLAPAVVEQLLETVRELHAGGTTVLLVEQSVNVALTVAGRAVFMDKGEIRFDGKTEALLARPDLVRSVFLGGASGAYVGLGSQRPALESERPERVLEAGDVRVVYGGVVALDGVTLDVSAGEIVGIAGPNGAGKTTLFDAISGFTPIEQGRIAIGGKEATGVTPDARARLGLSRAFQDSRLFPSLTVRENIAVALEQRLGVRGALPAALWLPGARRSEVRARRRVDYLVGLLGLDAFADKFVNELSTGSRRLVDIACVMATEPRILLLDEPSSGLAQAEVETLAPVVQRLAREAGCGVLVIEHDMPLLAEMADRLIAMDRGRVIADGAPADVLAHPDLVRSYLHASGAVINRSGDPLARALAGAGIVPGETNGSER